MPIAVLPLTITPALEADAIGLYKALCVWGGFSEQTAANAQKALVLHLEQMVNNERRAEAVIQPIKLS